MTTQAQTVLSSEDALVRACALVQQARENHRRGDVSSLIAAATAVLQGHGPALSESETIDATVISGDVTLIVVRGFQSEAAKFLEEAMALALAAGQTEVVATLFRAAKALDDANDAEGICAGSVVPENHSPEAIEAMVTALLKEKDERTARELAAIDPFLQQQEAAGSLSPALIVDENDSSEEEPMIVNEADVREFYEPLDGSDVEELDCSQEIVEVRTVPAGASDSIAFFDIQLPLAPRVPSMNSMRGSVPPPLPGRSAASTQLMLPFWSTPQANDDHEVLMTFHQMSPAEHREFHEAHQSMAN